jgi:hypothetical protein
VADYPKHHHPIGDKATPPPQIIINLATLDPVGNIGVNGTILGAPIVVTTDLSCALYQTPNLTNPIFLTNGGTQGNLATDWSFAFNNTGLNSGTSLLVVVFQTSKPAISNNSPVTAL